MEDDERYSKPDGHRYEAPESREETESKGIGFLVLGLVVIGLMVLAATGKVDLFPF